MKSQTTVYEIAELNDPGTVRGQMTITSVLVRANHHGHDLVTVWNRGGCAGQLTVNIGDGETIARRLIPQPRNERLIE